MLVGHDMLTGSVGEGSSFPLCARQTQVCWGREGLEPRFVDPLLKIVPHWFGFWFGNIDFSMDIYFF